MIATNEVDLVLATHDEWGIVQNSFILSRLQPGLSVTGWPATFIVEGEKYSGLGWFLWPEVIEFISNHRNAKRATSYTRLN